MKALKFLMFLMSTALPAMALADGGMIPYRPKVKIFEPGQTAVVAWNGSEEVLILSINAHASDKTRALQVVPLPSRPEISKGNIEVFKRIEGWLPRPKVYVGGPRRAGNGGQAEATKAPSVEVLFHKELGSHHVTTIQVHVPADFEKWFKQFVKQNELKYSEVPGKALQLVKSYCSDGYRYFALDIVTLQQDQRTISPVVYKFKSDALYYPLRISSLNEGNTRILLYTITSPILFYTYQQLPRTGFRRFGSKRLSAEEIRQVSPEIEKLFAKRIKKDQANVLGGWTYTGSLQLTQDLVVKF